MPEDSLHNKSKLSCVDIESFKAGVEALRVLIDEGRFFLFLPRVNWLRLVGDYVDFEVEFRNRIKNCEDIKKTANDTLKEMRFFLGALVWSGGRIEDSDVDMVRHFDWNEPQSGSDEDLVKEYDDLVREKLTLVSEAFRDAVMKDRRQRLKYSVSACLEDVDAELVRSLREETREGEAPPPYVRIRVHYSAQREQFPFRFMMGPNPLSRIPVNCFELECDNTDIDFLLKRLVEIKESYLSDAEEDTEE